MTVFIEMLTIHFGFTQCACISVDFINPTYPYLPVSPPPPPLFFFLSFFSLSKAPSCVFVVGYKYCTFYIWFTDLERNSGSRLMETNPTTVYNKCPRGPLHFHKHCDLLCLALNFSACEGLLRHNGYCTLKRTHMSQKRNSFIKTGLSVYPIGLYINVYIQ